MSARLNMNPIAYKSWKGVTFNQLTSSMQKNEKDLESNDNNYFRARGLDIYRREIANTNTKCNSRVSLKIDELNRPNGYLVYSSDNNNNKGLVSTLEIPIPNDTTNTGNSICNTSLNNVCLAQAANAKRRVRSSGMMKKTYDPYTNLTNYYTTSAQYLNYRNRTYPQNQFAYESAPQPTTCTPIVKFNNYKFASQGTVSSSTLVIFKKLNENTCNSIYLRP